MLYRHAVYRPYKEPITDTPVFVRSWGHYKTLPPFADPVMKKDFFELFWIVEGVCDFISAERSYSLSPGWVFVYLPGEVHQVKIQSVRSEYLWLTLDGPKLPLLLSLFGLSTGARYAGSCPINMFAKLDDALHDFSGKSEFEAGKIAYSILSDAMGGTAEYGNIAGRFKELVRENFGEQKLSVAGIASKLRIHRTTLHKTILADLGISPQHYILKCCVQEAMRLILDSTLSFKEIAQYCGFSDQNYFSKVIKKHLGNTPSALRKSNITEPKIRAGID